MVPLAQQGTTGSPASQWLMPAEQGPNYQVEDARPLALARPVIRSHGSSPNIAGRIPKAGTRCFLSMTVQSDVMKTSQADREMTGTVPGTRLKESRAEGG